MLTALLFPGVGGIRVERLWWDEGTLVIAAITTAHRARCPLCARRSSRVHSRYRRTIADLACGTASVIIRLTARRFVCRVPWCRRRIFTERLPHLVTPWARRTVRLQERLTQTGFALGGAPGARYLRSTGVAVSRRTLLRMLRAAPVPAPGPVCVLGVDDWAQRKGRTYGSILVNLETHQVIDLLPDRTAATFAQWLIGHPEVTIISRDRAGAYAEGARLGAPQARQVADRFHLLRNVTAALERFLARKHGALRQAADPPPPQTARAAEVAPSPPAPTHMTQHQCLKDEHRARRSARYEEIHALYAQGLSIRAVGRALGLARHTVQRYLRAEGCPERSPRAPRTTLITPFEPYLQARWAAGCHNAAQLWREIRLQGFRGGRTLLKDLSWPISLSVRLHAARR
jgi:transposase